MPKRTKKYEESLIEALRNPLEAAAYLNAHLENDEPDAEELFLLALRDVAKAHGIGRTAKKTSLGRESLYKTLSKNGNPKFDTLKALLASFGLKLLVDIRKSGHISRRRAG